jgi:hypothetical protein
MISGYQETPGSTVILPLVMPGITNGENGLNRDDRGYQEVPVSTGFCLFIPVQLDNVYHSFCDAAQLSSRRTLRGLPRPPIHLPDRIARQTAGQICVFSKGSWGWPNNVRR